MSKFRNRLLKMAQSSSNLPKGYYLCEYIESDGTQYIDTGFVPSSNTRVVYDVEYNPTVRQYSGLYHSSGSWLLFGSNTTLEVYIGSQKIATEYTDYDRYKIEFDTSTGEVLLNGITLISSASFTVNTTKTMPIFALQRNNAIDSYCQMKLYSCQIYDNDTLICDYIPCVSPSGYFGLYDTIEKTFYGSSTTTQFRGKVVIPKEYTWVEHIYGGGSSYIDTGFVPNQNTKVITDIQYYGIPTDHAAIFGARNEHTNQFWCYYRYSESAYSIRFGDATDCTLAYDATQRVVVTMDGNILDINGTKQTTVNSTFTAECNMTLFAVNNVGTMQYYSTLRMYSCHILDNDTIVRLYVPCISASGVYGLYDAVNKQFYSSATSTQFGEDPVVYDFTYTGDLQSITLDAGTYKLETWGAQGGSSKYFAGGYGGYSTGLLSLTSDTNLFIVVGGKGIDSSSIYPTAGGYNGGGDGGFGGISEIHSSGSLGGASGGGATHIATESGLLCDLSSSNDAIIIVAAGGGGASGLSQGGSISAVSYLGVVGGYGGGANGGDGGQMGSHYSTESATCGGGATHSSGGSPGYAKASAISSYDGEYSGSGGGGGGGGYYGGGGGGGGSVTGGSVKSLGKDGESGEFGLGGNGGYGGYLYHGYYAGVGSGGGGGCGYVSSFLTSASTIDGATSFPSTSGGTETGHTGNGYCRITKV